MTASEAAATPTRSATVVIPWRPQPSRLDAFDRVLAWYAENLPDIDVRTIDSDDPVFNLARCRNLAFDLADGDVLIINDADTLPERDALLRAIDGAATTRAVHLPYDEYRWFGAQGSAQYAAGVAAADCAFELVHGACSGVYVATAETWRAHGGQDERFRGWGFEDAAWYIAHSTMLDTPPIRIPGRVYALHHVAAERSGTQYEANAALMQRYRDASGDREALGQLLADSVSARNALVAPGS
ncbi:hypothetical protein ACFSBZ_08140 [Amnibacterium flavum]|uniref:Galactosyltransferase C-terminal domain-containing protein n=1 Tax=Amnibacterium flavum TaxID=2173173 RepID=A0A2V1HSX8_9MICO|nr:glycosyltransferase family A protein [Amnibacterium flavum]PVZ93427.1 hypothetical protein DDQ50_15785 [Amnibacterium flavum]